MQNKEKNDSIVYKKLDSKIEEIVISLLSLLGMLAIYQKNLETSGIMPYRSLIFFIDVLKHKTSFYNFNPIKL